MSSPHATSLRTFKHHFLTLPRELRDIIYAEIYDSRQKMAFYYNADNKSYRFLAGNPFDVGYVEAVPIVAPDAPSGHYMPPFQVVNAPPPPPNQPYMFPEPSLAYARYPWPWAPPRF